MTLPRSFSGDTASLYICRLKGENLTEFLGRGNLPITCLEGALNTFARFRGKRDAGRSFAVCHSAGSVAEYISHQMQVLQIPDTPDTDPQVKLQFDTLAQVEWALQRLRHYRHHLLTGRQLMEQPVSQRVHCFVVKLERHL